MAQVSPQVMFLVFFVYGLAWFVMGLAVALESRRTAALPMASSLKYLAAFGILHAAVEWLDMGLLVWDPGAAAFSWRVGRTLAMAVSTLFLALFGANLISVNTGGYRWLRWMSLGVFGVWLLAVVPRHPGAPGVLLGLEEGWLGSADILARYLLYLPGCVLAGAGVGWTEEVVPPPWLFPGGPGQPCGGGGLFLQRHCRRGHCPSRPLFSSLGP